MRPDHETMPDEREPPCQKRWFWRYVRYGLAALLVWLILDVGWFMLWPDVSILATENPETTAFMEYRKAQWQEAGAEKKLRWKWVRLEDISTNLTMAVTIAEDDKFWEHEGFDLEGIKVAMMRNLEGGGPLAGGSTISQQLVKNLYFSPSKNPVRKLNEAIVTWRLERELPKKRILELYLNCIEWGDGIFGIGAATAKYYGRPPKHLTRREAAHLAATLPNPLRWTPKDGSRTVTYRAKVILERLERRL